MYQRCAGFVLGISLLFSMGFSPPKSNGQGRFDRDELFEASEDDPFFTLSNLRIEKNEKGRVDVLIDYRCTRLGKAGLDGPFFRVEATERTDKEEFRTTVDPFQKFGQSGTIRIITHGLVKPDEGVEYYLYMNAGHGHFGPRILVSDSIKRGTMNSTVSASPREKPGPRGPDGKTIESKPPEPPQVLPEKVPSGHTRVEFATFLIPGTPVLYAHDGNWNPAKVVAKDGDFVTVLPSIGIRVVRFRDPGWVAVADDVLAKVQEDSNAYSSNLFVLPGGALALDDAVAAQGKDISKGMPLFYEKNETWCKGYFVKSNNMYAWVLVEGFLMLDTVAVGQLAVRNQTLEDVKDPETKSRWAKSANEKIAKIRDGSARDSFGAPRGFADFFGSGEGSSDSKGGSSTNSRKSHASIMAASATRTWTDRTGKFKVDAKLVEKTNNEVILESADGKRVTVPIDRLSETDQDFIETNVGR